MPLTIAELTATSLAGTGTFDVLMRAVKAHLDSEFTQSRLRGPEYATVYLGSIELAMRTGLDFLLQKDKADLERQLLEAQVQLANVQVLKAQVELEILEASKPKITAEIAHIEAQTEMVEQQRLNAVTAGANLVIEGANLTKQGEMLVVQKAHVAQQTINLTAESLNIPKQGEVLDANVCKLKAEFDLITKQILKTDEETALLAQKKATEKAQTTALGVDEDSVIGKQKGLYTAQTNGFTRDAEQKAAKLLADTWSVRRTTDEGTVADGTNMLNDAAVGRAINKLLAGVGA